MTEEKNTNSPKRKWLHALVECHKMDKKKMHLVRVPDMSLSED